MEPINNKMVKPLGIKAYGSICHLPSSRLGPGDHKLNEGQARILTQKARDRHDVVFVQEKLDGSNVCVARIDGQLVTLGRAGYPAISSPHLQHRFFDLWMRGHVDQFEWLREGERLCGEWLAQAHGTRYTLAHEPFVPFDLMRGGERAPYAEFVARVAVEGLVIPHLLSEGPPLAIDKALALLEGDLKCRNGFHGAIDPVEGGVWRVERRGAVDFLGKFVRPGKIDGSYLPEISGKEPIWNWRPEKEP